MDPLPPLCKVQHFQVGHAGVNFNSLLSPLRAVGFAAEWGGSLSKATLPQSQPPRVGMLPLRQVLPTEALSITPHHLFF